MKALEDASDIKVLVDEFYKKVIKDAKIGLFFTEIAGVNWDLHLPKMYKFWNSLLLGEGSYKGNPMAAHFPVNAIKALEKEHFNHWLQLWTATVKENFTGEKADAAVTKACNIASLMAYKMEQARRD